MQVREIMTKNPACCTPDTNLREVAQMMVEHDCGCIPVVENQSSKKPIGTITDRDITIRAFTTGQNPTQLKASDIMTMGVATISPETNIQDCANVMEDKKIRRVIVADESGRCIGIVAQADVAQYGPNPNIIGNVVHEISEAAPSPNKGIMNRFRNKKSHSENRSHSKNQKHSNKRNFSRNQSYEVESSSLFSTSTLFPLLAGIGISMGAKYFLDSNKETKPRPVAKPNTSHLSTGVQPRVSTTHKDISTRTDTPSTVTDSSFNEDITLTNREGDANSNLGVGRTAGQS